MNGTVNQKILLSRMDGAFSDYCYEAEKLSVLLAKPRSPSSWTVYNDLVKHRVAETVAYEKYRGLREELFTLIDPPAEPDTPELSGYVSMADRRPFGNTIGRRS